MGYTIDHSGMGGFLNPPGHAEYNYSVREGRESSMSLSYALTVSWVPDKMKTRIRKILDENPGVTSEEWIKGVYAYFRHCYSPDGIERDTSKMLVDSDNTHCPPEHHLGYLFVKQFVPDHTPRTDLF